MTIHRIHELATVCRITVLGSLITSKTATPIYHGDVDQNSSYDEKTSLENKEIAYNNQFDIPSI